jgi:hypothetical protein
MHLDGPRLEAMTPGRPGAGLSDEAGNVFFGLRVLNNETGVITTIGDDYWQTNFKLAEGPLSAFYSYEPYQVDGATFCRFVYGTPLEEGDEKGEKGGIYFADFWDGEVKKVFRNPEKDNRWWFKLVAGGGKGAPPQRKGESIPALEADLHGVMMLQVMPDDRLIVFRAGAFYELRDDKLVCLLGGDDHKSGKPLLGVMGGDGVFYLGYYYGGLKGVAADILRVLPDGTVEPYVHGRFGGHRDGDGMHTGYFCGPHFWAYMHNYKFLPKDTLFLCAHDDAYLRRARNGRVSTLCRGGEWREMIREDAKKAGLHWFRWLRGNQCPAPGPNGTSVTPMVAISRYIMFRVSGIDYDKPVIGPQVEIPPEEE